MAKDSKEENEKVGGLAFFLSFVTVAAIAILCFTLLPAIVYKSFKIENWCYFSGGVLIGFLIAWKIIIGNVSVMLHEFRHSVVAMLVGNKWKGLVVEDGAGHFEYAYSKSTARYNAFIALAPYWLPFFTIPGFAIAYLLGYQNKIVLFALVGVFYGIDLVLNLRDISPIQTDLTNIRGGYYFGLFYVFFVNLLIFSLIAVWVAQGLEGFKLLGSALMLLSAKMFGIRLSLR